VVDPPPDRPALLERDAEMRLLGGVIDAARNGRGGVVFVEAVAGMGKTDLLAAAAERARARSVRVLSARGGELEQDLAYGLVRQLFDGRLQLSDLDGPAARAARLLDLTGPLDDAVPAVGDDPTGAVLHGLYWLTANLAAAGPLALIVDDLHWADPASLRFAGYLAHRLETLPVVLVTAARPSADPATGEIVDALKRLPVTRLVALRPLSAEAVEVLVRDSFGESVDAAFCRSCAAATGGNPFLLRALLATLREEGADPDAVALLDALRDAGGSGDGGSGGEGVQRDPAGPVRRLEQRLPAALADAIIVRLGRLPAASSALARAVAVLGRDVEPRHAYALAELPPSDGVTAADALAKAGILRPGRPLEFTHPLVRAAVLAAIPPRQRADRHRAAAGILAADGADGAHRIAPHLLACDPAADPATVTALRRAAAGAVVRGAPDAAVRYLRRALDEPPAPSVRPLVLAELGRAQVRSADSAGAVANLRAALAATDDPRVRAEMAHDLAIGLIAPGNYREAVQMLAAVAGSAREVDPELGRRLEAELQCAARLDPSTLPIVAERVAALGSVPQGQTPGERMLLATFGHWRMIRGAPAAEVRDLVVRAVDGGLLDEQPGDTGVVIDALVALIILEEFERADAGFAKAFADVRARSSVIGFARLSCMRSMLAYRRGALADAESDARSAVETGLPAGYRVGRMAHGPLLDALIAQDRLAEAAAALTAAGFDGEIPDTYMFNYVLLGRGRLRLAQDDPAAAVADLTELDRREQKWRAPNPAALEYAADLALAHHRVGDRDAAVTVAERTLERARAWGTAAAVGIALRTTGVLAGDLDVLAESVAVLEPSPARLELARSLVDLGAAVRRAGQRSAAREPLRRGLELAHRCGAAALAGRARTELIATGSRPRRIERTGLDALTASERRVAALAADGLTNKEIAQALFVTVRTVQVHLQHAYRKMGVESRQELTRAMARSQ